MPSTMISQFQVLPLFSFGVGTRVHMIIPLLKAVTEILSYPCVRLPLTCTPISLLLSIFLVFIFSCFLLDNEH